MAFFAKDPRSTMLLGGGERISGAEVRSSNVSAAVAIANIVKSSLGPSGLDKMMVDDIGVRVDLLSSDGERTTDLFLPPSRVARM